MDKIKNFVVKYQLWFKIICALLALSAIFSPQILLSQNSDTFSYTLLHIYDVNSHGSDCLLAIELIIPLCVLFCLCALLFLVSIFIKKKSFCFFISICYFVTFLFLATEHILLCSVYKNASSSISIIPHVGFYLALLLFLFDLFLLYYLIKERKQTRQSRSDRIAELEKKVAELENREQK